MKAIQGILFPILFFAAFAYALYEHFQLDDSEFKAGGAAIEVSRLRDEATDWQNEKQELTKQLASLNEKVKQDELELANLKSISSKLSPVSAPALAPGASTTVDSKPVHPIGPTPEQLAARQTEVGRSYYVIVLKDGTVLKRVTVSNVGIKSVTFTSDTGSKVVNYNKLPVDMAQRLGLTKELVDQAQAEASSNQPPSDSSTESESNGATYFGVPANTNHSASSSIISTNVQNRIAQLKAQEQKLRDDASTSTDQADAQSKLQQAAKIDQLIRDLQDVGS